MENIILDKVKTTENIEELLTSENDSELLLQLSHMRRNLIEWIPLPQNAAVLEIGAGCGAITGLLADRCSRVVAVENQPEYLEVNRYLNREKGNIEYCSSLKGSDVNSLKDGNSEVDSSGSRDSKSYGFDAVVLFGISECAEKFGMSATELLEYAASRLAPTGRLILAMDNKYALKFWAGMKAESIANCFDTMAGLSEEVTYADVERQLMEAGLSSIKCFYPTPDYRLPIEIFSESYPVKAGSITENTRDYNQTRYQIFDEPLVADELCRDGMFAQFANSYLVIAEAASEQKELDKILYTKYNSIRDAKFQLRTSILEEDGKRLVEKAPMVETAKAHLNQMGENRNLLGKVYESIKPVDFIEKDDALYFTFVKGQPILKLSEEKGAALESLVSRIKAALSIIFDVKQGICVPFTMTDAFEEMYPDCVPADGMPAFAISNLDSIVSNFVRTEQGEVYCLDYEWVANFPIPENYVKYRSLLYVYRENCGIFASLISRDDFLHEFEIGDEEIALYDKMESAFQQYVHGKGLKYNYLKRYEKPSVSWEDLIGNGATARIEEYEKQLWDKDVHIGNLEKAGVQKDAVIANHVATITSQNAKIKLAMDQLQNAQLQMQAQKDYIDKIAYYKRRPIQAAIDVLSKKISKGRIGKLSVSEQVAFERRKMYQNQMERRDMIYENMMRSFEQKEDYSGKFAYNPLISVLVPVYNVADEYLIACIESVRNQIYPNWELCLADDCSTQESVRTVLKHFENDKRIKFCYRTENGHISKCTNSALEMATGEYVAFLDCDDLLSKNALYEVVKVLNENRQLDFIYSDEDKIFADGSGRHNPHFKPDWSPDTLMSFMYTSHLGVYRTSITREIGGLRSECDGAQDYDFTLRFTEQIPAEHICHIPKILYHWREIEGSTSGSLEAKPYVLEAQRKAKQDALNRRGLQGVLTQEMNQIHVTYVPQGNPKVSIIIPSKDNYKILKRAVDSLVSITEYQNYEVILVDNGSEENCRKQYGQLMEEYQAAHSDKRFIYHYEKMEFNFSHMCNLGASLASGEIYLFLNDDIEVLYPKWLGVMAGQAQVPHSGAVGAKLYYPDSKKIQHAGIIQITNGPSHAFCGFEDKEQFYFGRNCVDFNYCAVTGACLAVAADKFNKVGGFDENLPVAYNDVDLCFKLYEAGYYNVMRTDAVLYHHESVSRGYDYLDKQKMERLEQERNKLYNRHPDLAKRDPFYHPYLVPNNVDFSYNSLNVFNSEVQIDKNLQCDFESHLNVDRLECDSMFVFEGWSVDELCEDNNATERFVLLERVENGKIVETREFDTFAVMRSDVADCYQNRYDLDNVGFCCKIPKEMLNSGDYYVSLISVQNKKDQNNWSKNEKDTNGSGKNSRVKKCTAKKHRVAWMITIS